MESISLNQSRYGRTVEYTASIFPAKMYVKGTKSHNNDLLFSFAGLCKIYFTKDTPYQDKHSPNGMPFDGCPDNGFLLSLAKVRGFLHMSTAQEHQPKPMDY